MNSCVASKIAWLLLSSKVSSPYKIVFSVGSALALTLYKKFILKSAIMMNKAIKHVCTTLMKIVK